MTFLQLPKTDHVSKPNKYISESAFGHKIKAYGKISWSTQTIYSEPWSLNIVSTPEQLHPYFTMIGFLNRYL